MASILTMAQPEVRPILEKVLPIVEWYWDHVENDKPPKK